MDYKTLYDSHHCADNFGAKPLKEHADISVQYAIDVLEEIRIEMIDDNPKDLPPINRLEVEVNRLRALLK